MGMRRKLLLAAVVGTVLSGAALAAGVGGHYSSWGPASLVDPVDGIGVNTAAQDGCPIESPDGRSLYIASNRPGSAGLDLWVAKRERKNDPWGEPENVNAQEGADLNTAADEFCPTPVDGNGLFFVRRPSTCGLGDIYYARFDGTSGWSEPERLACAPDGPNSALDEMGPSYVKGHGGPWLYFSSSRSAAQPGGAVPGDIFVSRRDEDGTFGPAALDAELSDPAANDIQPNVRNDGREVVLSSNRAGGLGAQDIWVATRDHAGDPWSPPVNLANVGTASEPVNTAASETRPSLTKDAKTLYLGRAPAAGGPGDVYTTEREKLKGNGPNARAGADDGSDEE